MARATIKQRISLDGGKEIQAELEAIGEAGEKAFEQIRKAALKADLAKFGQSLNKFGSDLATVARRAAIAFTAITTAAGAAGAAMATMATSAAEAADQVGKAAQKTGLQVEAFQKLAHAADMSDVGQEEFVAGMSRLNRSIAEAAEQGAKSSKKLGAATEDVGRSITRNLTHSIETMEDVGVTVTRFGDGVGEAAKKTDAASGGVAAAFTRLGVRIQDASGKLRSNRDILLDLANAFSRMPDGAEKSALAMEIFGRSGAELLPFLNEGADGIKLLGDRFEELGGVFSEEQTRIGDALGDALDEVKVAIGGLRNQIGILFAPAITAGAEAFRDILIQNRLAIIEFGRAVVAFGLSVIRDLIAALRGNDRGVSRPWILEWRDAVVEFGEDVTAVVRNVIIPLFDAVRTSAQFVADAINKVFGSDVSGGQLLITAALLKLLGVFALVRSGAALLVNGIRLIGSALAFAFGGGTLAAVGSFFSILVRGAAAFVPFIAALVGWPGLIVAGLIAAGAVIVNFWDEIKAGASRAWEFIRDSFSRSAMAAIWAGMGDGAQAAWEAIQEGFGAVVEAVSGAFGGIVEAADTAWAGIVDGVSGLGESLGTVWDSIQTAGREVWAGVSGAAAETFDGIVGRVSALGAELQPYWDMIATGASGIWTALRDGASDAVEFVVTTLSSAVGRVSSAVGSIVGAVFEAFTGASDEVAKAAAQIVESVQRASEIAGDVEGAEAIAEALVQPFADARDQINTIWEQIKSFAVSGVNAILAEVNRLSASIDATVARIIAALQRAALAAARLRAQAASGGGGGSTFAVGGHVRGPGTSTSDSIPAWLSNGEFVIRAAAVRKFGAGFFAALNSLRMPEGFSLGGLVDGVNRSLASLAMPKMAMGGLVAAAPAGPSGRPFSIVLDGQTFAAVAAEDVAEKLARAASRSSLRSSGRKPGWFR